MSDYGNSVIALNGEDAQLMQTKDYTHEAFLTALSYICLWWIGGLLVNIGFLYFAQQRRNVGETQSNVIYLKLLLGVFGALPPLALGVFLMTMT